MSFVPNVSTSSRTAGSVSGHRSMHKQTQIFRSTLSAFAEAAVATTAATAATATTAAAAAATAAIATTAASSLFLHGGKDNVGSIIRPFTGS